MKIKKVVLKIYINYVHKYISINIKNFMKISCYFIEHCYELQTIKNIDKNYRFKIFIKNLFYIFQYLLFIFALINFDKMSYVINMI